MVKDSLNSTSLIFDHFKKIQSGLSIAFYLSAFIKDFNWGPVCTSGKFASDQNKQGNLFTSISGALRVYTSGNYYCETCEKSRIFVREGTSCVAQGIKN